MQLDTKAVRQACLLNAARLLNAAKKICDPESRHVSYHLAALALEEIGKASMVVLSSLSVSPGVDEEGEDELEKRPVEWAEDHERKLFWALFLPTFRPTLTASDFRQLRELARNIHETRLSTLYVDPKVTQHQSIEISEAQLSSLLGLADLRLQMESGRDYGQLGEAAQQNLTWFLRSLEVPVLRTIILSETFVAKLDELEGDYNRWLSWVRQQMADIEATNRDLAEKELRRPQPSETEAQAPKWQLKIRLESSSHSIRPKPLAEWNKRVDKIKLYNTPNKRELLVHFTLVKGIPPQALWQSGETLSRLFVIALNIGSIGFFWWYLPSFISKYYEKIVDLENNAEIVLERNPSLVANLQVRALKTPDLNNVAVVLSFLVQADSEQLREPYKRYFTALSLLAKTDVFVEFGPNILAELYESFRAGLRVYGKWNGSPEAFESALEIAFRELNFPSDFVNEVKRMFLLAGEVDAMKAAAIPISVDDMVKMKTFCDVFFLMRARQGLQDKARESVAGSKKEINPGLSNDREGL
jgi:AbiV family abortive infection protein